MNTITTPFVPVDESGLRLPLYRRICDSVRRDILEGRISPGIRLPASRSLADQLGVSRMTVVNAYDQLFSEGYLEGRAGSGTFVAAVLPEEYLRAPERTSGPIASGTPARSLRLSSYGRHLQHNFASILNDHRETIAIPFQHSLTAADRFPFHVWSKIAQKHFRSSGRQLGIYSDPAGYRPLRRAIAQHLKAARGVECTEDQVIITAGTQQAILLIGRILLSAGDKVWFENPGHLCAMDVLKSNGANLVRVPLDNEGLDPDAARKMGPDAKLVYVTPSRQFPLGMTMSLQRRLKLLKWASETDGWIVEDDYDSEFRFAGRPLPSLQGLDRDARVLYVGTFSKTVFPGLRIGCIVVPSDMVDIFSAARAVTDLHHPVTDQMILGEFIAEGHFDRHIRRMRTLYSERQQMLLAAVEKYLAGFFEFENTEGGMHLVGWLPTGLEDRLISSAAERLGVRAAPVSRYSEIKLDRDGLLLGYTAFDDHQITEGVRKLSRIADELG